MSVNNDRNVYLILRMYTDLPMRQHYVSTQYLLFLNLRIKGA